LQLDRAYDADHWKRVNYQRHCGDDETEFSQGHLELLLSFGSLSCRRLEHPDDEEDDEDNCQKSADTHVVPPFFRIGSLIGSSGCRDE
jgi:hypothetical protein